MENNQIIYAYDERKEKKFNRKILICLCCPAYTDKSIVSCLTSSRN